MAAVSKQPSTEVKDVRTVDTVSQFKETQKNLKKAEKNLNEKTEARQKKEAEIYKKEGQSFTPEFKKNGVISYQTKNENQPSALPEVKITRAEMDKKVSKELDEEEKAFDKWKIANYENNMARVNNEDTTLYDKTIGTPIRAISDLLSPLTSGESQTITDEQGNKTFLPSYSELKQQKVKQDSSKLGGFLQDIGYNATKILGAGAIDAVSGGLGGKALYWTDMATDNYKNAINQGYTGKQAAANTLISTGSEFLTERLLGGVSKTLTGGKTSELQSGISKAVNKFINNPKYSNIIGSMGAEGTEEFVQEWIGALNDKLTLGEDIDYEQTLKDALYSFGVGAGSGGVVTGTIGGGLAPQDFTTQTTNVSAQNGNDTLSKVQSLNDTERNALITATQKRKAGQPLDQNDIAAINVINNKPIDVNAQAQNEVQQIQTAVDNGQMTIEDANNEMQRINSQIQPSNNIENNENMVYNNGINEGESVQNEFRNIQEESRAKLNDKSWGSSSKAVDENLRGRIRGALSEEIKRRGYSDSNNDGLLKLESKGNTFNLHKNVDAETFHDVFEIARAHTDNGELVDLHPVKTNEDSTGYEEMNNYLSDDGMQGFSITKDGDVVSVFNADPSRKGFLRSIQGEINSNGKTLDCFNSSKQRLDEIYSKVFGWKTTSIMDHNMEYDHDDIAKTHNNPPVSFMVNPSQLKEDVTDADLNKKFGKDQYDEAVAYRSALMKDGTGNKNDFIFGEDGYFKGMKEGTSDSSFSNENIPATKEDNVITVKNKGGQELKLKQDKNNKNIYEKEVNIPKDNKSIVPKETMDKQLAKLKDGTKVSNFYSNVTENSKFITEENAEKLSQEEIWRYAPQTNKETMQKAEKKIGNTQKSVENAYANFLSKSDNFTPEDVAQGWIFLKRYQDAGNYDAMVQVAKKMRNIATKSGQTVQMFNIQSRLTPEGMVKYAQSELMDAEQAFNKGKSQKEIDKYAQNFELTGEEVEYIKNQMEKIQKMEDGRKKNIEMAKINKMLSDKLPSKRGDAVKAWMRISMLFNPKTQVRNIAGNALITPINVLADVPASMVDKAISKKTETRTIGSPSLKSAVAYGKGFAKGGAEAWQDYRMGIDTKDVDMSRFDVTQGKPFNESHKGVAKILNPLSKAGNKANNLLDLVMSGGDRIFYQGAFDASLNNQMKLNNVKTPTQDMIDIATQEALSRTWNDNNGYTQFVLNTRRGLNKLNVRGYGLGDVLIPFAKTPANLTKAIYDYSPVGLASSIFKTKEIKNAIETGQITPQMQHDFAQNIGKGVAGTMLYGIAYALAKSGTASGSGDDDKDVANFIKNTMGIQPYSININGKSYTYDWAQPIAAPLAIVTDAYNNLSRKSDENAATKVFNTILDVSNTGLNVLMQQSFLSGIAEVLNNNEGVVNGMMDQVLGLPARAVPTFLKQINDMFDRTQRTAYEKDRPLTTAKQNVLIKTPKSKDLAPSVDTLGNEIQKYGGDKNNITYAIKSFLSPANRSNARVSEVAEEIYKVYESTGDKTIMPKVAPYYIQNKQIGRVDLSSKDRAEYQKTSGKLVNEALIDLINKDDYNNLSDEKKAELLAKVVGYADAKAKENITGKISTYYSPADKKISNGMSIADYYLSKVK